MKIRNLRHQSLKIDKLPSLPENIINKLKENNYYSVYELQRDMALTDKIETFFSEEELDMIIMSLNSLDDKYFFEEEFIRFLYTDKFIKKTWRERGELYYSGYNSNQVAKLVGISCTCVRDNLRYIYDMYKCCLILDFLPISARAYRCLLSSGLTSIPAIIKAFEKEYILNVNGIGESTAIEIATAIDQREGTNLLHFFKTNSL